MGKRSPIDIQLPLHVGTVEDESAQYELESLSTAIRNLHEGLTATPLAASVAATDLPSALILLNEIREALIAKGIME